MGDRRGRGRRDECIRVGGGCEDQVRGGLGESGDDTWTTVGVRSGGCQ